MADVLTPAERQGIDRAIAAGRVTHIPPMVACGLSHIERTTGITAWAGMGAPAQWNIWAKAPK